MGGAGAGWTGSGAGMGGGNRTPPLGDEWMREMGGLDLVKVARSISCLGGLFCVVANMLNLWSLFYHHMMFHMAPK